MGTVAGHQPGKRVYLTNDEKAAMFPRYRPVALHLADHFAAKYRRQLPDMIDEAESALSMTICEWADPGGKGWNPTSGTSEATWVYRQVFYRLLNVCTRERVLTPFASLRSTEEDNIPAIPATQRYLDRLLRTVGEDAKAVINLLLHPLPGMDVDQNAARRSRDSVAEVLEERYKWTGERFVTAWGEIEQALSGVPKPAPKKKAKAARVPAESPRAVAACAA